MEILPESSPPRRDRESLIAFLQYCQGKAKERQQTQYASISLRVGHISPLAVLQSIFEPQASHFYIENPSDSEAIAGAEAIWMKSFSGESRFEETQKAIDEVLENLISIGDLDHRLAGPKFFFFHTFQDDPEEGSNFAPGTVFLPRWQVTAQGSDYFAIANLPITEDSPLEFMVDKVLAAHGKFKLFDYSKPLEADLTECSITTQEEVGTKSFEGNVEEALGFIAAGELDKLVISRAIDFELTKEAAPLDWLNQLREKYRECYSFSVSNEQSESFIGLTPELLLRVEGSRLQTEALAGSAPRGTSAGEDAQFAAKLLSSEKDLREHQFVAESIRRRLSEMGIEASLDSRTSLRVLPNVQHLCCRIEAQLEAKAHFWQILRTLHPTPAVGGTPKEKVLPTISELEDHPRGLYSGTLGWISPNGNGQAVVAIRSGLVKGKKVRLYAGAGIVEGSQPELEKRETDLKLKVLLEALGG